MYIDLVNHPDLDKYDINALNQAFVGGSPCSPDLMSKCKEKLNISDISVSNYESILMASDYFEISRNYTFHLEMFHLSVAVRNMSVAHYVCHC